MTTRREFLQAGIAASAVPIAAGALISDKPTMPEPSASAFPLAPMPFYKVVFDERFPDSVAFAAAMKQLGVSDSRNQRRYDRPLVSRAAAAMAEVARANRGHDRSGSVVLPGEAGMGPRDACDVSCGASVPRRRVHRACRVGARGGAPRCGRSCHGRIELERTPCRTREHLWPGPP